MAQDPSLPHSLTTICLQTVRTESIVPFLPVYFTPFPPASGHPLGPHWNATQFVQSLLAPPPHPPFHKALWAVWAPSDPLHVTSQNTTSQLLVLSTAGTASPRPAGDMGAPGSSVLFKCHCPSLLPKHLQVYVPMIDHVTHYPCLWLSSTPPEHSHCLR